MNLILIQNGFMKSILSIKKNKPHNLYFNWIEFCRLDRCSLLCVHDVQYCTCGYFPDKIFTQLWKVTRWSLYAEAKLTENVYKGHVSESWDACNDLTFLQESFPASQIGNSESDHQIVLARCPAVHVFADFSVCCPEKMACQKYAWLW